MDRFIDLKDANQKLPELIERARQGGATIITMDGQPVARLGPIEAAPEHRAKESRRGVMLSPEFEPQDARLARMERESEVPHRLRGLPKH
jgi:prevent-host-death family protein